MNDQTKQSRSWRRVVGITAILGWLLATGLVSCRQMFATPRQGWNRSLGPVVPHDKFPADCSLCHTGNNWTTIKKDFTFDHEKETGVPLRGVHATAGCLMCHNDRGPAGKFAAQGCAGCHVDPHAGQMGRSCKDCHDEFSWQPKQIIARHMQTRFPLLGAHAAVACFQCHPGAQLGNFKGAANLSQVSSEGPGSRNFTGPCGAEIDQRLPAVPHPHQLETG
jgi:hypothetical protein